jgi:hypothetical protein
VAKSSRTGVRDMLSNIKGSPKMIKKNRLLERLEDAGLVDRNLSSAAKHSRLKEVTGGLDTGRSRIQRKTNFALFVFSSPYKTSVFSKPVRGRDNIILKYEFNIINAFVDHTSFF